MSAAYRCALCGSPPRWSVTRSGDVIHAWACADDLDRVATDLQRDHEVTELQIVLTEKAVEWAEIADSLRRTYEGSTEVGHWEAS